MILLIDNYDSFSYNLYQMIGEIEPDVKVVRNDEISVDEIRRLKPERIILSPGPGRPEDAGILIEVVKELGKEIPILGVCLGHQAVCAAFGAKITYAKKQMHGKQSQIKVDTETLLFSGCSQSILAARYHLLRQTPTRFRTVSMLPPPQKTEKSWRYSIRNIRFTVCSSIRNPL